MANPYLDGMQGASLATGATQGNPYLDMLEGAEDVRRTQMAGNVMQAVQVNPDQYADKKRIAGQLGYPLAAVEAMPDITKQQAQVQAVQTAVDGRPVLANRYTDADFAKLAHDDHLTLASVSDWFSNAAKYVFSHPDSPNTLMGAAGAGLQDANRGAAGLFQGVAELPAPLLDWMETGAQPIGGNPLRRLAEGFASIAEQNKATATQLSPDRGGLAGGVDAGIRSFVQNILVAPAAILSGGAAAAGTMSAVTGGGAYADARAQGMDQTRALPFALSQAAIEYVTEKLPVESLIGAIKAGAPVLQTLAKQAALEIPGEQVATVLQDLNEWAVLPANAGKSFNDYLADRPGAAAQTLVATLIGVGGNVAVGKALEHVAGEAQGRQRQRAEATQAADAMANLFAMATESKLRERDPATFAALVQEMADNSEAAPTEVRFDARTLADTLQQSGMSEAEIMKALPSVAPQLAEAVATGAEVSVPVGEFSAIVGTPLEQALLQHARIGENELSQSEAKEVQAETERMLKQAADRVAQVAQTAEQTAAQVDQVRQQLLDQLNTAKRFTSDVNDAYATLAGQFYATMAERLGTTPDQLYAQFPLKVQARDAGGQALRQDESTAPVERPAAETQPSAAVAVGQAAPPIATDAKQSTAAPDAAAETRAQGGVEVAQGPRGTFSPKTLTISLLEKADLSTFLHEMGHFYLEVLANVASQPNAPAQVADDMAAVLKWFGVKDLATWRGMTLDQQRKYHERFAESFEQYLLEGKAPSPNLQPLFQRFRAWMLAVYRSLSEFMAGHNTQLSDEVRGVFDRLLATDEQIKQTEVLRGYAPLFESAKQAGMTPEAWAAYQAQGEKASATALDTLQARSMRDMQWSTRARGRALKKLQKDVAEKRKAVEEAVAEEVRKEPIYQALRFLRKGEYVDEAGETVRVEKGFRLNTEALAAMYPEGLPDAERLKPYSAGNGMHPDMVADLFGFDSGDQLVRAIVAADPISAAIEGKTDQRMLEKYGDLATEQGVQRAADEAVHNDARARFVATELKALHEANGSTQRTAAGGSVNVMVRAAKQVARELIARRKVRELKPGQHVAAETRAARAAQQALRKGDTQAAIVAKRDELLNHYAARATNEAVDRVERGVEYLKKFDKDAARKKLPAEYLDQIEKLLERVDLRQTTNKELDKRAKLAAWIEEQRAIGVEPDIPDYLLEDARLTSYRDMSVEQFNGLVDTVKQIEHLGRLKGKLLTAKDQREFDAVRDSIVQSILDNAGTRSADTRTPTTNLGRAKAGLKMFGASHVKVATWARIMDGGKDGGPVWEYFVRSANEAGDKEATMVAKATEELSKVMAPLIARGKLGGKGRYFQSIGRSLNRESILAIALNTGNQSNLQRLLGGEGWTLDQLQPVLATLTSEDWGAVQRIWDYFESFRPMIAEKERRVFGREPEWIEPGSAVLDWGDTLLPAAKGVKGGYYPVKYDPAASQRAEEHADAEGAKRQLQGAYGAATTRRSFTKARAEEVTGRPLLYTLQGVYSGVNEVVHDLAWHEWLIDVNRLMRSKAIDSAMREKYGPEVVRQFKSWRDDIAEGDAGPQRALDMALGKLRQSVSVAGLGFNAMSAMMQPLGLTQSIQRIGAGWVARGLWSVLGDPGRVSKEVNEKSQFMANRARTRFRELNELRNRVQGESALKRGVNANAYRLMMYFQRMVDLPTWQGAYEKAVAEGNDESRAVALADQAVIDSQGGGQTKDLAGIERGGPALKMFTVFYSFMNTSLNLGVASAMTPRSKARLAADMVMLYSVPAVLGALLKDALTPGDAGDDEEKLAKKLIAAQLGYLMGLMVVVREFGEIGKIASGEHANDYSGPAGLRAIVDALKFGNQAKQGEFDDAFRKAAVNLAGDVFGLPSAQINRTITGAKALAEGETQNPAAVVLGYQEPR